MKPISVPDFCSRMYGGGGPEDRERALQVGGDDRVPLVLGHVEQHPLAEDPGRADDAVDLAELSTAVSTMRWPPGHLGDRVGDGDGGAAGVGDLLDDGVGDLAGGLGPVGGHAVVVDHDAGALGGTGDGDGPADAPARPGDGDRLALQVPAHRCPLDRAKLTPASGAAGYLTQVTPADPNPGRLAGRGRPGHRVARPGLGTRHRPPPGRRGGRRSWSPDGMPSGARPWPRRSAGTFLAADLDDEAGLRRAGRRGRRGRTAR